MGGHWKVIKECEGGNLKGSGITCTVVLRIVVGECEN